MPWRAGLEQRRAAAWPRSRGADRYRLVRHAPPPDRAAGQPRAETKGRDGRAAHALAPRPLGELDAVPPRPHRDRQHRAQLVAGRAVGRDAGAGALHARAQPLAEPGARARRRAGAALGLRARGAGPHAGLPGVRRARQDAGLHLHRRRRQEPRRADVAHRRHDGERRPDGAIDGHDLGILAPPPRQHPGARPRSADDPEGRPHLVYRQARSRRLDLVRRRPRADHAVRAHSQACRRNTGCRRLTFPLVVQRAAGRLECCTNRREIDVQAHARAGQQDRRGGARQGAGNEDQAAGRRGNRRGGPREVAAARG